MLEIQNLTGGYGDTTVLRDVSISVPDASVVALLGPNGAGKTTTLRMASGLARPKQGSIMLERRGHHEAQPAPACARGVCASFRKAAGSSRRSPCARTSCCTSRRASSTKPTNARSTRSPCSATGRARSRARSAAVSSRCSPSCARTSRTRSWCSSTRRRSGLAPLVVNAIFEFIERIAAEGVSLLIVEQYINRALALASIVYLLHQGQIVYSGPAAGLDEERCSRCTPAKPPEPVGVGGDRTHGSAVLYYVLWPPAPVWASM